jgi:hypothetical protein
MVVVAAAPLITKIRVIGGVEMAVPVAVAQASAEITVAAQALRLAVQSSEVLEAPLQRQDLGEAEAVERVVQATV